MFSLGLMPIVGITIILRSIDHLYLSDPISKTGKYHIDGYKEMYMFRLSILLRLHRHERKSI